jgi:hypothetical protein
MKYERKTKFNFAKQQPAPRAGVRPVLMEYDEEVEGILTALAGDNPNPFGEWPLMQQWANGVLTINDTRRLTYYLDEPDV